MRNLNCFCLEFKLDTLDFRVLLFHKTCFERAPADSKSPQSSLTLCLASQAFLVWMFLWSTKVEPPLTPKWIFLVGNCASSLLSGFWLFVIMTSFILLRQQCPHGILWQAAASFPLLMRYYWGLSSVGPIGFKFYFLNTPLDLKASYYFKSSITTPHSVLSMHTSQTLCSGLQQAFETVKS